MHHVKVCLANFWYETFEAFECVDVILELMFVHSDRTDSPCEVMWGVFGFELADYERCEFCSCGSLCYAV